MRHTLTTLLLSVVLVGCASEEGLQQYASGKAIDPEILELGLPEITDKSSESHTDRSADQATSQRCSLILRGDVLFSKPLLGLSVVLKAMRSTF